MAKGGLYSIQADSNGRADMTENEGDMMRVQQALERARRAVRGFFYGMTVRELDGETRRVRADLEHPFMRVVFRWSGTLFNRWLS
jgi:hypothetical protein